MKNSIVLIAMLCSCLLGCQNNDTNKNEEPVKKETSQSKGDAYSTPTEDFSVGALKNGYSAEKAYEMHEAWTLQKFLDITEAGAYSYLQLSEFLPQNLILRDGAVVELEYNLSSEIGKLSLKNEKTGKMETFEGITTSENSPVQGVMVLKNGKIACESYPGMRKYDKHVWMSNAKVIAGLLIAQFEEEGLINVQKTVSNYVPKTKGTAWEDIKVIDILNMQTGLDLEENPASRKGATPYGTFVAAEMGEAVVDGKKLTHNEALFRIPKLRKSGVAFEYSSANTQMLGLILEAVGKKRISELITERVWMHAGMTGDALLGLSPQGNGVIHGLISSRLDDMAKFGMLFTPSWKLISSKEIVSQTVLKRMQTMGVKENFMKGTLGPRIAEEFRDQPEFNCYQWDAVFGDGDLYKSGMNGQGIYVSPSRDVVVVWFATGFTDIPMEAFARKIATSL